MLKKISTSLKQNLILTIASLLYIGWALAFIYRSSYAASDGLRYFNLFDDAMISMRYAWNFSHGHGLVWNIGERVEGYTNLLMTLLMSAATFVFEKRYAPLAIQLAGIFFPLGAAFFALRIFQTLNKDKDRLAEVTVFALTLLYYPLNFWSLMGMETGLLALLLGAGVYCSLLYLEKLENKYLWSMALAFGMSHLTRNESLLFAALAFVYLLPTIRQGKKQFLLAGALYALFVIGQLAFRYLYYGEFTPNTYTLKLVGMAFDERIKNGLGFIQPFLMETGIIIAVAIIGVWRKPSSPKIYLFGFFLISVIYQIYVGGDSWNYWRIMSPVIPFLFVVFTLSITEISEHASVNVRGAALITLAIIGLLFVNFRFAREMLLFDLPYQNIYARAHVETAIALNDLTDENATIGVFWAGSLPYYLDRVSIDFLGKSDKYIASLPPDVSGQSAGFGMNSMPGHNKHDLTYSIQTLLPTYVEEFDYGVEKLSGWAQGRYVRVKYGDVKLYLLKDSPYVRWDRVKIFLKW